MDDPSSNHKQKTMSYKLQRFAAKMNRRKVVDKNYSDSNLLQCLTTADVTLLGIGHIVGAGVFVLAPTVAKNVAGPAVVLSFLFGGIGSFIVALCYCELGVRIPKCGSAYTYAYLAFGEIWAFLVGWNVVLIYTFATAFLGKSYTQYVDSLTGGVLTQVTNYSIHSLDIKLDFFAIVVVFIFTVFLSFGVKLTSYINNAFTAVTVVSLAIVIGVGCYFSDFSNWTNERNGGFTPYGWSGVFAASATCFTAYVGFDVIATSSEEAKNPQKALPIATVITMIIATIAYVGVAAVTTLMVSYKDIANTAGLPAAFAVHGAKWAETTVTVGALCAMTTALIGCIFGVSRAVYAMAEDGLLFLVFKKVNQRTKIPLIAMYVFSLLAGFLGLILDIEAVVEGIAITCIFTYIAVGASVIALRYKMLITVPEDKLDCKITVIGKEAEIANPGKEYSMKLSRYLDSFAALKYLTVSLCVLFMTVFMLLFWFLLRAAFQRILDGIWYFVLALSILGFGVILSFFLITVREEVETPAYYKVPFSPYIPALSILVDTLLIANLDVITWIWLLVCDAIGLVIYFFYGMKHSTLNNNRDVDPNISLSSSHNSTSIQTICGKIDYQEYEKQNYA